MTILALHVILVSMKALGIKNRSVTEAELIQKAKEIPGAWTGLKIATLILLKNGHRPTELNRTFGLSRQTMTRWVHQVNEKGLEALEKTPPPGRPAQMTDEVKSQVEMDLIEDPKRYGLPSGKWNVHKLQLHLKRRYGIKVKSRQARNYLNELKPPDGKKQLIVFGKRNNENE